MGIFVHTKVEIAGFRYVIVGAGTSCIEYPHRHLTADAFRNLLASSERELERISVPLRQVGLFCPQLRSFDAAHDIAQAAISYIGRRRELEAVAVVAPADGLIDVILKAIRREAPLLALHHTVDPADALRALRFGDAELPNYWYRPEGFPEPGQRASSMLPPPPASESDSVEIPPFLAKPPSSG